MALDTQIISSIQGIIRQAKGTKQEGYPLLLAKETAKLVPGLKKALDTCRTNQDSEGEMRALIDLADVAMVLSKAVKDL